VRRGSRGDDKGRGCGWVQEERIWEGWRKRGVEWGGGGG